MKKKANAKPAPKATAADAQIVLHLYDMRREPVMREARGYMTGKFFPRSADEIAKLHNDFGSKENAYYRQVMTYWEQSASLVRHSAVNDSLFNAWAAEMHFLWAKFQPYIEDLRKQINSPGYLKNIESICEGTPANRERRINTQASIRVRFMKEEASA